MRSRGGRVALVLASCLMLSACLEELFGPGDDEPPAHKTQLIVALDAGTCPAAGVVAVRIDGAGAGDIQPGGAVTKEVEAGTHRISASNPGKPAYSWPETSTEVRPETTHRYTLTCPKGFLQVSVLNNCTETITEVTLSIDDAVQGTVAPGGSGVIKEVVAGTHSVRGNTRPVVRTIGPHLFEVDPGRTVSIGLTCP